MTIVHDFAVVPPPPPPTTTQSAAQHLHGSSTASAESVPDPDSVYDAARGVDRTQPHRLPEDQCPRDGPDHGHQRHKFKDTLHNISDTWHRCRPYLERINGTIVPLHHQGVDKWDKYDTQHVHHGTNDRCLDHGGLPDDKARERAHRHKYVKQMSYQHGHRYEGEMGEGG